MSTGGGSGRWGPQGKDPCPCALVPRACAAGGGAAPGLLAARGGSAARPAAGSQLCLLCAPEPGPGAERQRQLPARAGTPGAGTGSLWRAAAPQGPGEGQPRCTRSALGPHGQGERAPLHGAPTPWGSRGPARHEGRAPPGLGALGSGNAAQPSCHGQHWRRPCLPAWGPQRAKCPRGRGQQGPRCLTRAQSQQPPGWLGMAVGQLWGTVGHQRGAAPPVPGGSVPTAPDTAPCYPLAPLPGQRRDPRPPHTHFAAPTGRLQRRAPQLPHSTRRPCSDPGELGGLWAPAGDVLAPVGQDEPPARPRHAVTGGRVPAPTRAGTARHPQRGGAWHG